MSQPNYADYIKFMENQGYLDDVGSSDDLVEVMLNETVQVLDKQLGYLNIRQDTLVDIAYKIINSIEGKFKYYTDCIAAQGFEAAVWEVLEISEEVRNTLNSKVLNEGETQ